MVKKYIYAITSSKVRKLGGRNQTASIYEVKNNTPKFIAETKWNTTSYQGEKNEVYTKLKNLKKVSKKEYDKNDGLYYNGKDKTKIFKIE